MLAKDVFLCHAFEDKPMARSIALGLEQRGVSVWVDEAAMKPGDRLIEKIAHGIHNARWFVVLLTQNSSRKRWVRFELSQAMDREVRAGRTFVIPVLLHTNRMPPYLRNKLYIDLRDWGNFDAEMERLVLTIKGDRTDVPPDFVRADFGAAALTEDMVASLPASQATIELGFRTAKWTSRRVRTMSVNSGLTQKQVVAYCEAMPHIALSPVMNSRGDIYYGLRERVMRAFESEEEYETAVAEHLRFLQRLPLDARASGTLTAVLAHRAKGTSGNTAPPDA